jgi:RNA polymerase sigma factor (sigma-70 family)
LDDLNHINFRELIDANKNRVYNTAFGFVQNREDAEDITQEVFIEVHRSLNAFNRKSSPSTWIYRITVNKSLDFLRKKKSKKRFGFISSLFGEQGEQRHDKAHFDHPGVLLENKEKASILFSAIAQLPVNQKSAFILFHIEELSQKEIAEVLEISPKAVESLVQRAKAALKAKLEKIYDKRGI